MSMFGPDFPFAFDEWLAHPAGLGTVPAKSQGKRVAVVGAGISGLVCAHEVLKMGLEPVVFESGRLGGRLRSEPFSGAEGSGGSALVAELGGMRFPESSTAFFHYVNLLGLQTSPFPNPLTPAAGSTVVDLGGESHYAESGADLPPLFQDVAAAFDESLERGANFSALKAAMRDRNPDLVKQIWDPIVRRWDEGTFYDFISSSAAFRNLTFRHREVFGQVGFGTGGWDSDFSNSMLEILRVAVSESDENQHLVQGGVEQLPRGLWNLQVRRPDGTEVSLAARHRGSPRPGVARIARQGESGPFEIVDRWGHSDTFDAVVTSCQGWLLTTSIDTEERLFSQQVWMALDRTRYMQSSKTFIAVDRPFWKDKDPETGRDVMSMTLTDRITRGTYLFDDGPDKPAVMCLTYTWMSDALKMLPLRVERRVELSLDALEKIYPGVDIRSHIIGDPITVSWEDDPNFLGAFKGALPGHYRYNRRTYGHFVQSGMPAEQRGIFLAGDDVSWTPGWAEGAVQTALNAVWGVMTHFGGSTDPANPGPGDLWDSLSPVALGE